MSGSNPDKKEGKLKDGTLNEIVDFNSQSIDHGRVSKLLSPHINNVPLFLSITGMDTKDIGPTTNVEFLVPDLAFCFVNHSFETRKKE